MAITFYTTTPHQYTFRRFIRLWQPEMAATSRVLGYSGLDLGEAPAPGLHVLTDFERLKPDERDLAVRIHQSLQRPGNRVVGNPQTWLDRHQLLGRLHEAGINQFRALKVDELVAPIRFPVFLRWADSHRGPIGAPIRNRRMLARRLARIAARHTAQRIGEDLLVIEKLDVRSPDGLFRKYSVAKVGEHLVPRHVEFSDSWVTKMPDVVTEETAAEEARFLAEPPDLDLIGSIFEMVGCEYGRIDWGYVDGRPQVWEINTNPQVGPGDDVHPLRRPGQQHQADLMRAALESLADPAGPTGRPDPLIPRSERRAWRRVQAQSREYDARRR